MKPNPVNINGCHLFLDFKYKTMLREFRNLDTVEFHIAKQYISKWMIVTVSLM